VNNVASQTNDPQSLLSYYRNWIAARKRSAGLMKGDITPFETGAPILAFIRETAGERVLVVHNLSDSLQNAGPLAVSATGFETIYTDSGVSDPSGPTGAWHVTLPAHSSGAWRVR
jgi:glycosidase